MRVTVVNANKETVDTFTLQNGKVIGSKRGFDRIIANLSILDPYAQLKNGNESYGIRKPINDEEIIRELDDMIRKTGGRILLQR